MNMEAQTTNIRENTGTTTGNLRAMGIGLQYAINVSHDDVYNIRGLITKIHSTNDKGINAGYRFKTVKIATGIKVWRIA